MRNLFVLVGLLALALFISGGLYAEDKKEEKKEKDKEAKKDKDTKKDEKPKDIKTIMKATGKLKGDVTAALKKKDFEKATEPAKTWCALGNHLGGFEPSKGEKDAFKKQAEKYGESLKALVKGVEDKDEKAANESLKTLNASCGACHKEHKGK